MIDDINAARLQIKNAAETVLKLLEPKPEPEVGANVVLAYRHLEDASMRLGKAIQALDGGISVYDKRTTVGT